MTQLLSPWTNQSTLKVVRGSLYINDNTNEQGETRLLRCYRSFVMRCIVLGHKIFLYCCLSPFVFSAIKNIVGICYLHHPHPCIITITIIRLSLCPHCHSGSSSSSSSVHWLCPFVLRGLSSIKRCRNQDYQDFIRGGGAGLDVNGYHVFKGSMKSFCETICLRVVA